MDVSLKREYAQGWISNYEAGGGININGSGEGKWLGRLFAMRYTNHSSLAFFAGSNNLNDAMNVSGKGEWKKNNITDGEFKTNMGGVSFALDPKDIPLKFSTELRVQQQRHIGEMREDRTDYYTDIVTNRKNLSKSSSSNTNFNWYANVLWTPKSYYIKFEPFISYIHNKMNDSNTSTMLNYFDEMNFDSIYVRNIYEHARSRTWNAGTSLFGIIYLPKRRMLDISQRIEYSKVQQHNYIEDELHHIMDVSNSYEFRNRPTASTEYHYIGNILYQNYEAVKNNEIKLRTFFKYQIKLDNSSNKQDLLKSSYDELTPSVNHNIVWYIDPLNSFHSKCHNYTHTFDPYFDLNWKEFFLTAHGTVNAYFNHPKFRNTLI